jgi:hypothetical protein
MIYEILLVFFLLVAHLLLKNFFPQYFNKKGENLATKEDISEITSKIEIVKHEYARLLETTRADLSARLATHGFRYEKEYEVLNELTSHLVDVRDTTLRLRPVMDYKDPDMSEDQIKQERLRAFFNAQNALYQTYEKKRPFYPNDIYEEIHAIRLTAREESIKYQYQNPFEGNNHMTYWDEAMANQDQITASAEKAMQRIRDRVNKWDDLLID